MCFCSEIQSVVINTIAEEVISSESEQNSMEPSSELSQPLLGSPSSVYSLDRKVEIGELSELFLGRAGQALFFLTIIVYLMGDLAIYATTIADSLARVTGGWSIGKYYLSETEAYYIYVLLVLVIVAPLGFLNFNSPYVKYLQFVTMAIRNLALLLMISLTIDLMANRKKGEHAPAIPFFRPDVPSFFGTAIYAFMCHHSLPGIIAPMKDKRKVTTILGVDFILIASLYILLGVVASICFGDNCA
jgi:amino acid permease